MAVYTILSTNVSLRNDIAPAFGLGTTNISLNTAGQRAFPRVNASGTQVSELYNKTYYYLPNVFVYDDSLGEFVVNGGTVEVTSPMTISPSFSIEIAPTYVITSPNTTITLKYTSANGYSFLRWTNQSNSTIGFGSTLTVDLTNTTLNTATQIHARVFI